MIEAPMKIAAVDIQGFQLDLGFIPKEVSIRYGLKTNHFLCKPVQPYDSLNPYERKYINHADKNITGLKYSHDYVEYQDLEEVLRKHLNVDFIYLRGHQKYDFLKKKLEVLSMHAAVVNIGNVHGAPTFKDEIPSCLNHRSGTYRFTQNNVSHIFNWLLECLPQ